MPGVHSVAFCEEQICWRFALKYLHSWLLWVKCFIMMTSARLSNLGLMPEYKVKGVILLSSPDAMLLRSNLSRGTAACDFNPKPCQLCLHLPLNKRFQKTTKTPGGYLIKRFNSATFL